MVLNADGAEMVYVDANGITLRAGSIYLLNDWLSVNTLAYDGSAASPSRGYIAQPSLGSYRMSIPGGGYGEGYAVSGTNVWWWAADGLHLAAGAALHGGVGMNYTNLWVDGAGITQGIVYAAGLAVDALTNGVSKLP
jgi:hypothetical protein